jgi:4-aminobutyrate aminotransferase-like enzyme
MEVDNPLSAVALQQQTEVQRIVDARERYVARGISTTDLVVARGNVVRVLAPILAADEEPERGLEIIEESLVGADRARA